MRQRGFLMPGMDNTASSAASSTNGGAADRNGNSRQEYQSLLLHSNNSVASTTTDDADIAAGRLPTTTATAMSHPFSSNDYSNNNSTEHGHILLNDHHDDYYKHHNAQQQQHGEIMHMSSMPSTATLSSLETAPTSACTLNSINTVKGHPTDLEFFEDLITEPVLVLGVDISHLSHASQFAVCACGLFAFSLLYGYLQELLSVELCSRKLGLFLALTQFSGYTVLAFFMREFVYAKQQSYKQKHQQQQAAAAAANASSTNSLELQAAGSGDSVASASKSKPLFEAKHVPLALYLGLSLLRAIDLAMTNLAMQYINYPAKTLMKSSRVVFTMLFGVLIQRKVYKTADYAIVIAMVAGLAMFMHADANSSAVFHHMGVIMLTISLVCDGTISNMSETIMSQFGVGQDEFIFRLYSISLMAIATAATVQGDLWAGLIWMSQPGTYQQYLDQTPLNERSWSVTGKVLVMILFSTMGFFGSSTSAAITKNFGALTMSITSTARKATTLFLSFLLFNNVCTAEHVAGMAVFIAALTTKSLRRRNGAKKKEKRRRQVKRKQSSSNHHHHHGASNTTTPTIVSIRSHSESTPERLTFRHGRGNSNENIELLSSAHGSNSNATNRMNLVHIV